MLFTIVVFIAVLAVLVLAHEAGHFFTARRFGCQVEEFGFGFPPRIFGRRSKKTGILYSLNWIPLGGFVKIKGEDGENRDEPDSFGHKKAWQRAIILIAGVTMNFVLAVVLLTVGFGFGIPTALPTNLADLGPQARIANTETQIYLVAKDSPAEKAGLKSGDVILTLAGQTPASVTAVQDYLAGEIDKAVNLTVRRDGQELAISVTPVYRDEIGRGGIGIALARTGIVSYPWYWSLYYGAGAAGNLAVNILVAFYTIIKNLIIGQPVGMEVTGPVGIAVMTGEVARMGIIYMLQFIALLSINLAIINFLPLPALDGGRLLFLLIEKLRRRPVNQQIENFVHNLGFLLLMLLMVFVTYRDVVKWGGGLFRKIFG
ncbi:MAG: RIP metalloprotease RseP [Patescibacteria group bacterium]|jgi:regulator of sigma E protease